MEDRQILQLLWQRSEGAIAALSEKFGKRIYQTALNILTVPEDAQEAVNDTYLALWDAIPPARPDPLGAYVYRVGRNTALSLLRSRTAQKRDSSYDLCLEELAWILPGPSVEEALDARALGWTINQFLSTLDSGSRTLFLRRYWYGDSVKELSRSLGIPENVAAVRLHRIRSRLKEYLQKEGFWHEA